jgi:TRAP-type mannitol/chloroaromatic compound transport system permease large subunit
MSAIFKSAIPFLFIQLIGLVACMLFPEITTWLPRLMYSE